MNQRQYWEKLFEYKHLPSHLQAVSKEFYPLSQILLSLPFNPESTTALRKLLECKDCAVRAVLIGEMNK